MGFWDAMRGRTRPKQAELDALFMVPSAAITLETAAGLVPTGEGAVCFRAAEGAAFSRTQADVVTLLDADGGRPVRSTVDRFGFTWLVTHDDDITQLCTELHAVNTALEAEGFGPSLLCSLVPFADPLDPDRRVGLVYLYKRGTFYPFAPRGEERRDNLLEIQVRDQLSGELPIEADLQRWLAVWGAPGL
ncbi:PspA-associated protein PspAB [Nocardioides donggukensis]|uniref:Uncharacterized protein n=1 Tax=Nocardioides donggukensis TaxID=2774019 RepID=A0A927Q143_9ACTN|nr:hypothetical protein [Nocardioides donggukensis]MBD8869114.1 hypothetical protein [Nocardioides donggukensis]